jgi:hypothetical protein
MTERTTSWVKTGLTVVVIAIPFFVGWGSLNARVNYVKERQDLVIAQKADIALVTMQYNTLLRETAAIKELIRDHIVQTSRR